MSLYQKKANGKLLLTSEYFVLKGANAIVLPTLLGQSLTVEKNTSSEHNTWKSYDEKNVIWLEKILDGIKVDEAKQPEFWMLDKILYSCNEMGSNEFVNNLNYITRLEFDRTWGLGSSATLISLLADYGKINPYELLERTFGGSGYDIAAAFVDRPFMYNNTDKYHPSIIPISFSKDFFNNLYFVYLEKKQNSREGIARFHDQQGDIEVSVDRINEMVNLFLNAKDLNSFEEAIQLHENIVSSYLKLEKVKDIYFKDYWGAIKSLGAWGGDFVLVTNDRTEEELNSYMKKRGFGTVIRYEKLVKNIV